MKVTHIILTHDDHVVCRRKKCKNKVLITPVDIDGNWSCPKCNRSHKIVDVERISLVHNGKGYEI